MRGTALSAACNDIRYHSEEIGKGGEEGEERDKNGDPVFDTHPSQVW